MGVDATTPGRHEGQHVLRRPRTTPHGISSRSHPHPHLHSSSTLALIEVSPAEAESTGLRDLAQAHRLRYHREQMTKRDLLLMLRSTWASFPPPPPAVNVGLKVATEVGRKT